MPLHNHIRYTPIAPGYRACCVLLANLCRPKLHGFLYDVSATARNKHCVNEKWLLSWLLVHKYASEKILIMCMRQLNAL